MKILLDFVGCRLNQSEIEKMAFKLRCAGHEVVSNPAIADAAIINTCTVTSSAAADSRKLIRKIARAGCGKIITTGCLSTIDPTSINDLPSVISSYSNPDKEFVINDALFSNDDLQHQVVSRSPLPGKNKRTRAFIKIQDGCDNFCTFCITRIARGKSNSITEKAIFDDIEYALAGDVKEIVLTGVNLGSWGKDLDSSYSLHDLIRNILKKFAIPRIRLSSIEPWDVDDSLLDLLQHPAFCHHFHLPLQSGCDATLRRMGRKITSSQFRNLVEKIRMIDENTAITTDIIVGFPGETINEFQQSFDFIRAVGFSGGHVFRFSPRIGTPASNLSDRVNGLVKKDRSKIVREALKDAENKYLKKNEQRIARVLWERSEQGEDRKYHLTGTSDNYITVNTKSDIELYNKLSTVKIVETRKGFVFGEIVS